MTKDEFWALITLLDASALDKEIEDGEADPVTEPLIKALASLPKEQITAFDDIMSELLYDLDGEAWAQQAGVSGQFEDLFLYCRCVVVASGREAYAGVFSDPTAMPAGMEFERLLDIPALAWRRKTGTEYEHTPRYSLEMRANQENWSY